MNFSGVISSETPTYKIYIKIFIKISSPRFAPNRVRGAISSIVSEMSEKWERNLAKKNFSREWKIAWKKLIFPNSDVSFLILADSDRDSDRKSRFLDRDWKEKETSKASKLKAKIKSERSGGDSGWGTPNSRYKGLTWMTFCSYRTLICAIEKFSTRKWFFAPIFTCTPIFWHKSLSARNLDQFRAEWFLCRKKILSKHFRLEKISIDSVERTQHTNNPFLYTFRFINLTLY